MFFDRLHPIKFLVICEELGVDSLKEPGVTSEVALKENKGGRRDPVKESSWGPVVSEGEVKDLKDGEKGPKAVDKPMLVFLCNSSDKVEIVEGSGN